MQALKKANTRRDAWRRIVSHRVESGRIASHHVESRHVAPACTLRQQLCAKTNFWYLTYHLWMSWFCNGVAMSCKMSCITSCILCHLNCLGCVNMSADPSLRVGSGNPLPPLSLSKREGGVAWQHWDIKTNANHHLVPHTYEVSPKNGQKKIQILR